MRFFHVFWSVSALFWSVAVVFWLFIAVRRFLREKRPPIEFHFMPATWRSLPPVHCPLLIRVEGLVLHASRTSHIEQTDGDMEYLTACGRVLLGRFDWTYP
ncbi:hypothetical protein [Pseudomonas gingeri]|uniref:hypothetical protein n=1 Tax=Pseudomonas gingeri TaxID=117681 RepID=UPI0015A4CC1B|nr:hypothetical protein [Pseudomonas gingeri]NWA11924.1 hypothetical protein [Pseudomonas gingeri]